MRDDQANVCRMAGIRVDLVFRQKMMVGKALFDSLERDSDEKGAESLPANGATRDTD